MSTEQDKQEQERKVQQGEREMERKVQMDHDLTAMIVETYRKHRLEQINFEVFAMGDGIVECTLLRYSRHHAAVKVASGALVKSLAAALMLLDKVETFERLRGTIKPPAAKCQPYINGYHRVPVDGEEWGVVFQRISVAPDGWAIRAINRMDKDGFTYADPAFPVPSAWKLEETRADGSQLYTWDDMVALSGSTGEALVLDGLVVKTKMTAIS